MVSRSTPEQLSVLLKLDPKTSESWGTQDLRALISHQMAAPLDFDLGSVKLSQAQQQTATESLTEANKSNIRTFGELFHAPHPPLELLRLSQKFFKQNFTNSPKDSPEQKVAYLFYLLSIVAARIRTGVNISKLPDEQQLKVIESLMKRSWVEERIRKLLVEGRKRISSN